MSFEGISPSQSVSEGDEGMTWGRNSEGDVKGLLIGPGAIGAPARCLSHPFTSLHVWSHGRYPQNTPGEGRGG